MKKEQGKGLVLLIIIVLVVLAFWWLVKSGYKLPGQTARGPAIKSTADLNAASKDLDNTNLNEMDAGINQLSADSSSF